MDIFGNDLDMVKLWMHLFYLSFFKRWNRALCFFLYRVMQHITQLHSKSKIWIKGSKLYCFVLIFLRSKVILGGIPAEWATSLWIVIRTPNSIAKLTLHSSSAKVIVYESTVKSPSWSGVVFFKCQCWWG